MYGATIQGAVRTNSFIQHSHLRHSLWVKVSDTLSSTGGAGDQSDRRSSCRRDPFPVMIYYASVSQSEMSQYWKYIDGFQTIFFQSSIYRTAPSIGYYSVRNCIGRKYWENLSSCQQMLLFFHIFLSQSFSLYIHIYSSLSKSHPYVDSAEAFITWWIHLVD